jgi:hypothetical protein
VSIKLKFSLELLFRWLSHALIADRWRRPFGSNNWRSVRSHHLSKVFATCGYTRAARLSWARSHAVNRERERNRVGVAATRLRTYVAHLEDGPESTVGDEKDQSSGGGSTNQPIPTRQPIPRATPAVTRPVREPDPVASCPALPAPAPCRVFPARTWESSARVARQSREALPIRTTPSVPYVLRVRRRVWYGPAHVRVSGARSPLLACLAIKVVFVRVERGGKSHRWPRGQFWLTTSPQSSSTRSAGLV